MGVLTDHRMAVGDADCKSDLSKQIQVWQIIPYMAELFLLEREFAGEFAQSWTFVLETLPKLFDAKFLRPSCHHR